MISPSHRSRSLRSLDVDSQSTKNNLKATESYVDILSIDSDTESSSVPLISTLPSGEANVSRVSLGKDCGSSNTVSMGDMRAYLVQKSPHESSTAVSASAAADSVEWSNKRAAPIRTTAAVEASGNSETVSVDANGTESRRSDDEDDSFSEVASLPKRRGRPAKSTQAVPAAKVPKRRGRRSQQDDGAGDDSEKDYIPEASANPASCALCKGEGRFKFTPNPGIVRECREGGLAADAIVSPCFTACPFCASRSSAVLSSAATNKCAQAWEGADLNTVSLEWRPDGNLYVNGIKIEKSKLSSLPDELKSRAAQDAPEHLISLLFTADIPVGSTSSSGWDMSKVSSLAVAHLVRQEGIPLHMAIDASLKFSRVSEATNHCLEALRSQVDNMVINQAAIASEKDARADRQRRIDEARASVLKGIMEPLFEHVPELVQLAEELPLLDYALREAPHQLKVSAGAAAFEVGRLSQQASRFFRTPGQAYVKILWRRFAAKEGSLRGELKVRGYPASTQARVRRLLHSTGEEQCESAVLLSEEQQIRLGAEGCFSLQRVVQREGDPQCWLLRDWATREIASWLEAEAATLQAIMFDMPLEGGGQPKQFREALAMEDGAALGLLTKEELEEARMEGGGILDEKKVNELTAQQEAEQEELLMTAAVSAEECRKQEEVETVDLD